MSVPLQLTGAPHPLAGGAAQLAWLLPLLPLLGALVNGVLAWWPHRAGGDAESLAAVRARVRPIVSLVGPLAVLAAFGLAVAIFFAVRAAPADAGAFVHELAPWLTVAGVPLTWAVQIDALSVLMTLVITGIGFLIHVFSVGYMGEDPGYARYFAYLNLFVAAMLVLVLGANYPVLFVGWEGVGLASYLLIGFWFRERANAEAARKAFIVNRIGDAGLLIGMFLLARATGRLDFVGAHELLLAAGDPALVGFIALAFFVGCAGKSAQLPLYVWLPDAMAGPTPVSALIHAATMVTAGVYLVARAAPVFAGAPTVSLGIATIGALTALFAATIALRQWDIKKVLAYSTVSQLGYMFVGVGTGAYVAGVFHLVTHAFFKALLFLGAGAVIHAMHAAHHADHDDARDAQDLRHMGGLAKAMPLTATCMWLATLAIAGIPPLAGFFSKDEILAATIARAHDTPLATATLFGVPGSAVLPALYGIGLLTALLTAFYMGRLMLLAFHGSFRGSETARGALHEAPATMTAPLVVLAALTLGGGWLNLPELVPLGPAHALADWLAPVVGTASTLLGGAAHLAHDTEVLLIAVAVGAGVAGLAAAWWLHGRRAPSSAVPGARAGLLEAAYHVDALLDRIVVRPLAFLADRIFARGTERGVEGIFGGGASLLSRGAGAANDRVGAGDVGRYAWLIALGALAVLAAFVLGG